MMSSTQHSAHTVREQLNEDNEKQALFKESSSINFLSTLRSRNSYLVTTGWVLYWIKLFTWVTVSACTLYEKWCLYYVVSYFFTGNRFNHANPKVSNKYKIGKINQNIIVIIAYRALTFRNSAPLFSKSPCTVLNWFLKRKKK